MKTNIRKSTTTSLRMQNTRLTAYIIAFLTIVLALLLSTMACSSSKTTTAKPTSFPSSYPATTTFVPKSTTTPPQTKPAPKPKITLPNGDLNIGTVLQKTTVQGAVEVSNSGDSDLYLYRVDGPVFFKCKTTLPMTLSSGQTSKIDFMIDTSEAKSLQGSIHFQTNDSVTSNQDLRVLGVIDPISITARERQEQYLLTVSESQSQFLEVTDLGRSYQWSFGPLPNYSCDWSIKISNKGPGKADGTITVMATRNGSSTKNGTTFHLDSKGEITVKLNLPINFLVATFGGHEYKYEFSNISEEVTKERTLVDIYKVTRNGSEKIDTFLKESDKAKTWQEIDYYKPGTIVVSLNLQGVPNTTASSPSPTSQPVADNNPTIPVATPAPVTVKAPPDFDLTVNNPVENHSGLFPMSINVQVQANITNTGDQDAHNTKARIQAKARSNGQIININGQNIYVVPLGIISGKQSLDKDLSFGMSVGMSTALDLQSNGISFQIDIISDEAQKSITITYP